MTSTAEKKLFVQMLKTFNWPSFLPQFSDSTFLQDLWVAPFEVAHRNSVVSMSTEIFVDKEIVLSIPGVDALALTIAADSGGTVIPLELEILPDFLFRLKQVPI